MSASEGDAPLGRWRIWLYAFPSLPHAFVVMPLTIVVPTFYAAHTSITLAQIALITTLSRLLDAVLDPLVGVLSDKTRTRLGRRKPWVLAGALTCAVAILCMFQPPAGAGVGYYAAWSFLLYLGFSFFEIPRGAWTTELSRDYLERTRLQSAVAGFSIAGSLVFWGMPILLSGTTGTFAVTGESLTGIAWLYALLMPAGVLLSLWLVPNGHVPREKLPHPADFVRALRGNRPLWLFLALTAFWGLGQGAYSATIFIFVQDYLGLAEIFPLLMILFFAVQIACLPVWLRIVQRIGKHRAWAIGMVCDVATRPLVLLFAAGSQIPASALVGLILLGAFFGTPSNFAAAAILGDIVDYDLMKSRVNKAARFFALQILLVKATMAFGAGAAFLLLDTSGYAVGGQNGPAANMGLIACYLIMPALCFGISAWLAWCFPITARRHEAIRRRIERWNEEDETANGLPL